MSNTMIARAENAQDNAKIVTGIYLRLVSSKNIAQRESGHGNVVHGTLLNRHPNLEGFYNFYAAVGSAFPDYEINIESMMVKGDKVMVRYTVSGTHEGNFMGMEPTHEKMVITGIDIFRLSNGIVVEHWDAAHQMVAVK